jgi:hypothetical protein
MIMNRYPWRGGGSMAIPMIPASSPAERGLIRKTWGGSASRAPFFLRQSKTDEGKGRGGIEHE